MVAGGERFGAAARTCLQIALCVVLFGFICGKTSILWFYWVLAFVHLPRAVPDIILARKHGCSGIAREDCNRCGRPHAALTLTLPNDLEYQPQPDLTITHHHRESYLT